MPIMDGFEASIIINNFYFENQLKNKNENNYI